MKKNILTILKSLICVYSFAQAPNIQWQKTFGGTDTEYAYDTQQTSDGGYIVAGHTVSNNGDVLGNHGEYDAWVVKLNSTGVIIWQKLLGGTGTEYAKSIQQTSDGGYIVAGSSASNDGDVTENHGSDDFWVVKLNSTGQIVWQKALGGTDSDYANSIKQTQDGGYIVVGYTYSNNGDISGHHGFYDSWVVKLNSTGAIVWQKALGGSNNDTASSILQTSDGGYLVAGHTNSNNGDVSGQHGNGDCWLVKLNSTGAIVWQKTFGGTEDDNANSIFPTLDGGYILAGLTGSNDGDVSGNHGDLDVWIVKINSLGTIVWQKTLGGTDTDYAYDIQQTPDGQYIVAGQTYSNDGDVSGNHTTGSVSDFWAVKLNSIGTIVWQKALGGTDSDFAHSIKQTQDGGYIIAGVTGSNDGDITDYKGTGDWWVVKLASENLSVSEFEYVDNSLIYPNPSKNHIIIQNKENSTKNFYYKIIDLIGRVVLSGNSKFNEKINIESLTTGNYIIQIKTENNYKVDKKLIKD